MIVAGALGVLEAERHPTGGLDPAAAAARHGSVQGPMRGRIEAMTVGDGLRVRTELDPARQRFLDDHRIDGTPVLPGVMGVEGFAETARALLPDWSVVAIEDVDLLAPFKFYRDEPRALELHALVRDGGHGALIADCRLIGRRALAGQGEQETVHFTGRVRLAREAPAAPLVAAPPADAAGVAHDDVYRVYFHGPAYQVLDHAYGHDGVLVGCLALDLPADHEPRAAADRNRPAADRAVLPDRGRVGARRAGRMALPTHIDRLLRYARPAARPRVRARAGARRGRDEDGRRRRRRAGPAAAPARGIQHDGAARRRRAAALEPIRLAMAAPRSGRWRSPTRSTGSRSSIAASRRCG